MLAGCTPSPGSYQMEVGGAVFQLLSPQHSKNTMFRGGRVEKEHGYSGRLAYR